MTEFEVVRQSTLPGLSRIAGWALGTGFGMMTRARGNKPIHSRGVVAHAVVERTGSDGRWGAEWLDEPGTDDGVARFSRSVGLPAPLPDFMGLAFRIETPHGRHDLLLATTGLAPASRYLLMPARHPLDASYGTLLPYRTSRTSVLLAAVPEGAPRPASAETDVARALENFGRRFRLLAARPFGSWTPFAILRVSRSAGEPLDPPIVFDPVLNPLPGLSFAPTIRGVREPSYRAARRGHGAAD